MSRITDSIRSEYDGYDAEKAYDECMDRKIDEDKESGEFDKKIATVLGNTANRRVKFPTRSPDDAYDCVVTVEGIK